MPRSAGMHKSGVRMVREKAMDGFFKNLLGTEMVAWVNWPHERIADECDCK